MFPVSKLVSYYLIFAARHLKYRQMPKYFATFPHPLEVHIYKYKRKLRQTLTVNYGTQGPNQGLQQEGYDNSAISQQDLSDRKYFNSFLDFCKFLSMSCGKIQPVWLYAFVE